MANPRAIPRTDAGTSTRRTATTHSSNGTVTLRMDRRGRYRLVDARRRPIAQASRFLAAVAARGLSGATMRAYGFDLVVLTAGSTGADTR